MKTSAQYKEYVRAALDLIEESQKNFTKNDLTTIQGTSGFDVTIEQLEETLIDITLLDPTLLEVINFLSYRDAVETHWMDIAKFPPPRPGQPEYRPIAEIKINGPVGYIRNIVERDFSRAKKPELIIDKNTGIYFQDSLSTQLYKFKFPGGKNHRVDMLELLYKKAPRTVGQIAEKTAQDEDTIYKAIKALNKATKKKPGLSSDLIVSVGRGYQLNSADYSIIFRS